MMDWQLKQVVDLEIDLTSLRASTDIMKIPVREMPLSVPVDDDHFSASSVIAFSVQPF